MWYSKEERGVDVSMQEENKSADKKTLVSSSTSPDVEFCGYSAPHPSEPKIHLRLQMYGECSKIERELEGRENEDSH